MPVGRTTPRGIRILWSLLGSFLILVLAGLSSRRVAEMGAYSVDSRGVGTRGSKARSYRPGANPVIRKRPDFVDGTRLRRE